MVMWCVMSMGRAPQLRRAISGYPAPGRPNIRNRPGVVALGSGQKIDFLTDVEGNWEYFVESAMASEVLEWTGPDRGLWGPGELCIRDGCMFVFGGDAPDKGPGDIRVVKTLLSLKARYPDRCFIVLGNRDVNKLRFFTELDDAGKFQPYWNKGPTYKAYLEKKQEKPSRLATLRWMLDDMGCATTFATRQRELALLMGRASDEDVLDSFRESVDPDGWDPWMLSLLIVGHIAVIIGDVLFVHAGLPEQALGYVPGTDAVFEEAHHWVNALNRWKDSCLKDYLRSPGWRAGGGGDGVSERLAAQPRRRGGDALMDYGVPGGHGGRTVMYVNPFENGNPVTLPKNVADFLKRSGIRVVVSGHQPHGQMPTIVRNPRTGLLRITADTSFSNMTANKHANVANNRGDVRNFVVITQDTVQVSGVASNTGDHACVLHRDPCDDHLPDALVGRQLQDGSWIKTVLRDPESANCVVAARGAGYKVSVKVLDQRKAQAELLPTFVTPKLQVDIQALMTDKMSRNVTLKPELSIEFAAQADVPQWPRDRTQHFDKKAFDRHTTYIFDGHGTLFKTHLRPDWHVAGHARSTSNHQTSRPRTVSTVTANSSDVSADIAKRVNEFIRAGKRLIFVTNSSNQSRKEYLHTIANCGIQLPSDALNNVVTSSFTCAWYLRNVGVKAPFVLASHTGLLDELRLMGITDYYATIHDDGTPRKEFMQMASGQTLQEIVKQHPHVDAIVVGWDQHVNALKISVAAAYVKWSREAGGHIPVIGCACDERGILGVTSNDFLPDQSLNFLPIPAVGNGIMTQAVCACVGDEVQHIDVGKPSRLLLEVLRRGPHEMGLGVDFSSTVVIGDTLDTDVHMARLGGMKSLLVLTGITSFDDLLREDDPMKTPDWLLPSVAWT